MNIVDFIKEHPAKVYGYAVSIVAMLMTFFPQLPKDHILTIVSAVIAIISGHAVQNVENRKTTQALYRTTTERIPEHLRDSPGSNF
ncbi:hypothetical protein O1L55_20790 [Streptomyces albulus]|nr:hypothetical protein [Streptomyces noursei]